MKIEPKYKCPHCGENVDKVVNDAIETYDKELDREFEREYKRIINEPIHPWRDLKRAFSKENRPLLLELLAWLAAAFLMMAAIIFFAVKCSPDTSSSTKTEIVTKGGQK